MSTVDSLVVEDVLRVTYILGQYFEMISDTEREFKLKLKFAKTFTL